MDFRQKYSPHMMVLCAFAWALVCYKFIYIDKLPNVNQGFGVGIFFVFILLAGFLYRKNKKELTLEKARRLSDSDVG